MRVHRNQKISAIQKDFQGEVTVALVAEVTVALNWSCLRGELGASQAQWPADVSNPEAAHHRRGKSPSWMHEARIAWLQFSVQIIMF